MKILVVGLGSMGKRRIRCLKTLGYNDIIGFDAREDRKKSAGIRCIDKIEDAAGIGAAFICTPPDKHIEYIKALGIRCFVEHGIFWEDLVELDHPELVFPSCTMVFHSDVVRLKKELDSGMHGKLSNIRYHSGSKLSAWHPYENISDFYVSKKETGAIREIVPFELSWMCWVFGMPIGCMALRSKTIDIEGAPDIEDTYNGVLSWSSWLGVLTVDVTSQKCVRELTLVFDKKEILLDLQQWVSEQMYVDETKAFMEEGFEFPNNVAKEILLLRIADGTLLI